ncbi:hypothetical protein N8785_01575 [Planktomarina temperata]|nr:hypothetical protein [Planktomarina temperata]
MDDRVRPSHAANHGKIFSWVSDVSAASTHVATHFQSTPLFGFLVVETSDH